MASERVEVRVGSPYPVLLGSGLDVGRALSGEMEPGTGGILTDSDVGPLWTEAVKQSLEGAGWRVEEVVEVPAGESSKSLATYAEVVGRLSRAGLRRDGTLFALGGGVIGDLGGFVAATYLRGVALVMLPTSLLAMVDSSVGGKAGVDLPEGKNLVGSFVRPGAVISDLDWLDTLPDRQLSCGLAEVIKMSLLAGGEFFEATNLLEVAMARKTQALQTLAAYSVRFKAEVVAEDERESGRRAILNYGHTIGHGLEAASGYTIPHGEAVSAGMVAAARLSARKSGADLTDLHERLLRAANLPVSVAGLETGKVLAAMGGDKKRRSSDAAGEHRFVLLEGVGEPAWGVPVAEDEARRAVEAVVG